MSNVNYKNIFNNQSDEKIFILQNLDKNNYLENKIIPNLQKPNKDDNNENDIYLSILLIKYKNDLQINILESIIENNKKEFSYIFHYIINDEIKDKNDFIKKEICLIMLNLCVDHIYIDYVKNELIKLCSIFIWVNLSKEKLTQIFSKDKSLLKNFLALAQMNKVKQGGILSSIYCCYLNSLIENILLFFDQEENMQIPISYIIKGILLLISLLGINNTRKFLSILLIEKHFIERFNLFINEIKNKKKKKHNDMDIEERNNLFNNEKELEIDLEKFEFLYHRFSYYYFYELIHNDLHQQNQYQSKELEKMQKKLYNLYPEKMRQLLNVNFIFSDNRKNLIDLISYLSDDELYYFLKEENLINYQKEFYFDKSTKNRNKLLQEIFICKYIKKVNILEQTLSFPLYPNESILIPENNKLIPNYYSHIDYKSSIIIPKLSYTYLSLYDYLLNNYYLYKYESSYEITEDLENCLEKMGPLFDEITGKFLMKFNGWSLMGYPILDFQVLTSQSPLVGEDYPREVIAEITYDLNNIQPEIRKEWENFKKYDTIFLIYLNKDINRILIRGAEINSLYDEDDNNILSNIESYNINLHENNTNEEKGEAKDNNNQVTIGFKRRMIVNLDPIQYTSDLKSGYLSNLTFHMILRRKSKENNFKSILQSIKNLIKEVNLFPNNFNDIILNNTFLNPQKINKNNNGIDFNEEKFKSIKINNKKIKYKPKQLQAIKLGIQEGLSIIKGPPGTGKTDIAVEIINYLYQNKKNEKMLIITHSNNVLNDLCKKIIEADIVEPKHLLRLGKGNKKIFVHKKINEDNTEENEELYLSLDGKITYMLNQRKNFLDKFLKCMLDNKITIYNEYTCQSALSLLEFYFIKKMNQINENLKKNIEKNMNLKIEEIISELKNYLIYELLRDQAERRNFIITKQSKIIALTCTYAAINRQKLIDLNFTYDTIIMEESGQILEIESFIPMTLQKKMTNLKRVVLLGDDNQLPPIVKCQAIRTQCLYHLSLFSRLLKTGYNNCVILNEQGRSRSEIVDLYRYKYDNLIDMKEISKKFNKNNFGFKHNIQFVNVEEFNNHGEEMNSNNSFYNLAEAEYCIGLFMYMCLVGYNANKISILTTYNGQKELIKEIYSKKCGWNKLFSKIGKISTVDKYQGQQNDFIILSLVRSEKIGYLRDIRRFIVSLSRARQGLYIFGKWDLFYNCIELNKIMNIFKDKYNSKNRKLELCIDGNENNIVEVEDFRHMYRLVQELLKIAMNNSENENNNEKNKNKEDINIK